MTRYASMDELRRALARGDVRIPDERNVQAAPPRPAPAAPSEHDEQVMLIQTCETLYARLPELRLLFAIPNGGQRSKAVAGKLKAEGVRAGVPDLFLPVARRGHHGMFIEMKRADGSNHATPEQAAWLSCLRAQGYHCVVAYGATQAIEEILSYLEMKNGD